MSDGDGDSHIWLDCTEEEEVIPKFGKYILCKVLRVQEPREMVGFCPFSFLTVIQRQLQRKTPTARSARRPAMAPPPVQAEHLDEDPWENSPASAPMQAPVSGPSGDFFDVLGSPMGDGMGSSGAPTRSGGLGVSMTLSRST